MSSPRMQRCNETRPSQVSCHILPVATYVHIEQLSFADIRIDMNIRTLKQRKSNKKQPGEMVSNYHNGIYHSAYHQTQPELDGQLAT